MKVGKVIASKLIYNPTYNDERRAETPKIPPNKRANFLFGFSETKAGWRPAAAPLEEDEDEDEDEPAADDEAAADDEPAAEDEPATLALPTKDEAV